jgi:hypothetical protein
MLPIDRGRGADSLYAWLHDSSRLTEQERRRMYAYALGTENLSTDSVMPNKEFHDLWLRALSLMATFNRQLSGGQLAGGKRSLAASEVQTAARNLALNLSQRGYGAAQFAASRLSRSLVEAIDLLSEPDVAAALNARDMWQVVDRVARQHLGGPVDTNKARSQAESGAAILRWLSRHLQLLDHAQTKDWERALVASRGDLLRSAETWLAAEGTSQAEIAQYAEAKANPVRTLATPLCVQLISNDTATKQAALRTSKKKKPQRKTSTRRLVRCRLGS